MPSRAFDLMLFDISGVKTVRVKYCNCRKTYLPHRVQLLRVRWFPATIKQPGMAFTFRLLNRFHNLQTRSKISLYDFYTDLISSDNPCGIKPTIVSVCLMFDVPQR